jgi:hypothetical protein
MTHPTSTHWLDTTQCLYYLGTPSGWKRGGTAASVPAAASIMSHLDHSPAVYCCECSPDPLPLLILIVGHVGVGVLQERDCHEPAQAATQQRQPVRTARHTIMYPDHSARRLHLSFINTLLLLAFRGGDMT